MGETARKWGTMMEKGGEMGGNGGKWRKVAETKEYLTTSSDATYSSDKDDTPGTRWGSCAIEAERHISLVGAHLHVIVRMLEQ